MVMTNSLRVRPENIEPKGLLGSYSTEMTFVYSMDRIIFIILFSIVNLIKGTNRDKWFSPLISCFAFNSANELQPRRQ